MLSTLIAFFAAEDDSLRSLRAGDHSFVFLLRWPLYLLCVSRTGESEGQLRDQLRTLHSGFISLVTASQLHRAFEQKIGYDLRNMLGGTDGYLDSLPKRMHRDLGYLLSAVHSLRLSPGSRQKIGTAMALSRPKHLVFALLIAKGKLVTLVRPRAHPLNPSDLHLVLNLLASNPSFRSPQAGESWSPICLPKFNSRGFLHGYIAPLAEDLTLVGLSTEREGFWDLQGWKESLVATLEAKGLLQQLDQATRSDPYSLESAGIPLFHHFIYKSRSLVQYTQPAPEAPYERDEMRRHLVRLYSTVVRCVKPPVHVTVGPSVAPAIVVHKRFEKEAVVGLVDGEREVYGICSPLATAKEIKDALEQIRRWGKKLEAELFVLGAPTF